ncbi:MAG TPA: DUF4062 domain-containing protein, partial [Stellaceae bacterium]
MIKVFVSSTGKDLQRYRDAVCRAIARLDGFVSVRMEDFGARDEMPLAVCLSEVAAADLFVGITGQCYGSHPPDSLTSFTEHEYDAAVAAGKPRLMFVAPHDFAVPANLREGEEEHRRQQDFRRRVTTERVVAPFDAPEQLAVGVVA